MKILIPVDGSPCSNAALDFVASRAALMEREPDVRVLNVQPMLSPRIVRMVGRAEANSYLRSQADDILRPALARLKRAGVAARASYVLGRRADAIAGVAVRGGFDLVAMGSRGRSALAGLLFGSMTSSVLAGCSKPLLVLRGRKVPRARSLSVGIAVDGSRYGLAAARWALGHRELFGDAPAFELVHVEVEAAPEPARDVARRGSRIRRAAGGKGGPSAASEAVVAPVARLFARHGIEARAVLLRGGNAGEAIAAHAKRRRLDLLVMGSHGFGAMRSLVLGSVATRVAARSDLPLLLIRAA